MKRVLLGSLATVAVVASLLATVTMKRAQATVANDQVAIAVSGSLSSMTSSPSLQPAFSPSTHDYAIYCQSGVNLISFNFGGVTPAAASVSLGENQAALVEASNGPYWIRCLPHDFPVMQFTGSGSSVPGWYLTGNVSGAPNGRSSTYAMVLDSNGTPVWYQKAPGGAINVEALANNVIAWMPLNGPGVGADPSVGYNLYNLETQTTQTVKAPLLPTDPHELYPMPNGDYMVIGTPIKQLASPFNGNQQIIDCVVQEVNRQGTLVWSWRASDHVAYTEGLHAGATTVNGHTALDVYHCNSVDVDPITGQVLVSMRNTSALYQIRRVNSNGTLAQDGAVIWKLNGCGNNQVGPDQEPLLSVQGDPEACFDAQHDARFQPNGEISLYDDHSYQQGGGARGVVYAIDTGNSTATWVSQYPTQPGGANASATGSFRSYANGTDNLVGWGFRPGSGFTEADGNGNPFFSMTYPNGELEYRVVKVPLNSLDINALRATAGLPRPTFPTVGWGTLGGVLTSKPAVAAWSSNRLDAFGRGTDGQLWHRWWAGTRWNGWEPLGGQLYPGTGPAVASWAPGRLDVFVEGTDRQLWHRSWNGRWSSWEPLGGILTSGPAASSWGPGRLDVVVGGTDHAVWHNWFSAGVWRGWESLGGQTTADPAIASWAAGRADVFVKGTDNQSWHRWYDSTGWHAWEGLGGNLTSGPAAASLGNGLVDVAAAGSAGEPERLPYNAGWQIWQPLRGATSQPPTIVPFNGGEDVFVTGTDSSLWFGSVSTTGTLRTSATMPTERPASITAVGRL